MKGGVTARHWVTDWHCRRHWEKSRLKPKHWADRKSVV